jgi:pyridoxine 5'-phosphate synthase PdxJ
MVDRASNEADIATLVPEKREEVRPKAPGRGRPFAQVSEATRGSRPPDFGGLIIDPVPAQIEATQRCGATEVEFHTGSYANARGGTSASGNWLSCRGLRARPRRRPRRQRGTGSTITTSCRGAIEGVRE